MSEAERRLLSALTWMAEQYLSRGEFLDSLSMCAGERAIEELARYGLVAPDDIGRTAVWTQAGLDLLQAN